MTRRAAGVDQAQAGQLVLQAIFDHFRTTGRWPTADNIDRQLRRRERGLDVARLIVDMPRELVPRTWPNGVLPRDHDVRRLSPFGIARCLDAGDDVDLYLRALRWLASYEERTDPERGQTSLMVTHRQLARALRVPLRDSVRLQRLFQLLQHERWGGVGSGDAGGGTS